ncbi:MAG TPA: ABC transporter permease [Dehalococcoidia bacterium]|nr:ABC transporter permease [Dehalococcoidia bacterium]
MIAADISYRAVRVWQRNRDVFRHIWKPEVTWPLFEPLIVLFGLGLGLGKFVELSNGQEYIQFITPGLIAAFPMWATIGESGWGSYSRMETQKTYDAMVATPVSIDDVIAGEVLWAATKSLIAAFYILATALLLTPFYDLVQSPLVVFVLPMSLFAGLMFASMGLLATSFVRSVSQLAYFVSIVILPMFWVGGVFFPLDQLSEGVRTASWFMPLRHVASIQRALVTGDVGVEQAVDVAWIAVVTLVLFYAALWSMRRRLIK